MLIWEVPTVLACLQSTQWIGESLRCNRIGATGLRASERKSASERVSEREGFQRFLRGLERFLEVFRGFQRFSEVLRGFQRFLRGFQRFLRGFQRSSQRPSQRQICSQRLSVLLPLIVLPLELSPNGQLGLQFAGEFSGSLHPLLALPQGSRHIKILRSHINSLRWWQNNTTIVKYYGRVSETHCFPRENSQEISTNRELLR